MKLTKEHILAWVDRNFDAYKIRQGGQEIVMANPWGDSGQHFNVSLVERISKRTKRKGFWVHDWRPGHQQHDGSFLRFVQEVKKCSFHEALKDVCGKNVDLRAYLRGVKEKQEKATEIPEEEEISLPVGSKRISEPSDSLAYKFATNYLKSRAISIEEAIQHYIHYDSVSIIFPYVEFGIVVYWQSRSMAGKTFEFPPQNIGVTKSEFIYGFDQMEPNGEMIIVEAVIDAINIGPGAGAMGGAQLSDKQIKKIKILNPVEITLAGDNDKPDEHGVRPGIASIWHNYQLLKPYYPNISYCIPPDPHKDWNDMKVAGLDPMAYIQKNKIKASIKTMISLRGIN